MHCSDGTSDGHASHGLHASCTAFVWRVQPGLGAYASSQILCAAPRSQAPGTHVAFGAWGVPRQPGARSSCKVPPARGYSPARIRALPGQRLPDLLLPLAWSRPRANKGAVDLCDHSPDSFLHTFWGCFLSSSQRLHTSEPAWLETLSDGNARVPSATSVPPSNAIVVWPPLRPVLTSLYFVR